MNQIVVALSGRKQAGKNTIGKFIQQYVNGSLSKKMGFDGEYVYECSFADTLKEFCIETLGLDREMCYGTDEQKNKPTQYSWENCSDFLRWKFGSRILHLGEKVYSYIDESNTEELRRIFYSNEGNLTGYRCGPMSSRDIMQIFGTDLIRETFGNVWAASTMRRIANKGTPFAIITDNRFPNEIDAVLDYPHGYIIRLKRSPFGSVDVHPSESALDNFNWNRERCFVLDNSKMSITEQEEAVKPIIDRILSKGQ